MHGSSLAATDEVVCLCADPADPVLDRIRAWAEPDIEVAVHPVGTDVGDIVATGTLGLAVGGDGTFLEAVQSFAPQGVPIAGVSRGTLSFLSRIPVDAVTDALADVCRGRATVLERQRFSVASRGLDTTGINDVMVEPPADRQDCRVHAFVDEEYVGAYAGGGLSVNPPTGSTAMGLSASGPVQHPDGTETLQLVALHPDRLGVRSVIADAGRTIALVPDDTVRVTVDGGRTVTTLAPGTRLDVTGADRPAHLVRTGHETGFMRTLAAKLGWALRETPPAQRPDEVRDARLGSSDTRTDTDELARAASVAREAALAAGGLVRRYRQRVDRAESDQRERLVARAEQRGETVLGAVIENAGLDYPTYTEVETLPDGRAWVLDAIDGRTNFTHGNPNYCTTVALLADGRPVVGVVHAPETGELFCGVRDRASRNGVTIGPTDRDALDESMLLSGYDPDGQFLRTCYRHTRGVRRLGSHALAMCFVAAGSADALWTHDARPVDVAAGLCILRAAGGRAGDAEGGEFRLHPDRRTPILASNGPLHDAVLALLSE